MSAGPDRFDVAQLAADAAEWDELSSHRALDVGGAAAVRWHDLRDELAEAAAPAAAHMAHQAEEIAGLRRRLEEERVVADLTSEQLDKLEALALSATPGPWTSTPEDWTRGVIAISHVFHERDAADWAHIAAASPDVVLALVAAARPAAAMERSEWVANNESLRAERAQVREVLGASTTEGNIEAARRVVGEAQALRFEIEHLCKGLAAQRDEAEQLRGELATALEAPARSTMADLIEMARLCRSVAQLRGVRKNPAERGPHRCDGCQIFRRHDAELRAEVERLRGLGLEAVEHGARNALQSPASLVRLYKIRAEIERKP